MIGTVQGLWRYPVKSMRGEELREAFAGFSGVYGDRCYAIHDKTARRGFPYLTATRCARMLLYRPRFRFPERAALPPNLSEAIAVAPGATPSNAAAGDWDLEVVMPTGEVVPIDSPALLASLANDAATAPGQDDQPGETGPSNEPRLSLLRSDRALTDCRPLSLISLQTIQQIGREVGRELDPLRFRANVYLDMPAAEPFHEDALVGRELALGPTARVVVLERDPRCRTISLDPDTAAHTPDVLRAVAGRHDARAGVYCAVLVEGLVQTGNEVGVVDR